MSSALLGRLSGDGGPDAGKRPHIIMVFAPKGGVGKTAISTHLAVSAAKAGHKVIGIDCDSQRAFKRWEQYRLDRPDVDELPEVTVHDGHIQSWSEELHRARHADIIVIDTAPGVEKSNLRYAQELGAAADLIIMPTEAAPGSLIFVREFIIWWKGKTDAFFVLNKTMEGRTLVADAREHLAKWGELWEDVVPHREAIARAYGMGLTVADSLKALGGKKNNGGAEEIEALWSCCAARIGVTP